MKSSFFDIRPESAHPEIIKYLLDNNLDHFVDSKDDKYLNLGAERIKKAFEIPNADIHYMPNGTITNVTALSSMLKPFEGVICPATGHINNAEAGAFEGTGHKILTVETKDGKITIPQIEVVLSRYKDHNNVVPKAIYLTQLTEEGTAYTKNELTKIISYAKTKDLYVYLDGARLAMAIASKSANITMVEFGALGLDMFYIGGTKNGGLYGEALIVKNDKFKKNILNYMKRQGAQMGKQRPMSLQFARFFDEDNLWLKLAEHANSMGKRLREGLAGIGAEVVESDANHAFVILDKEHAAELEKHYEVEERLRDEVGKDKTKIRLVCSWATKPEEIDDLIETISKLP
jgi:threonine aldolase